MGGRVTSSTSSNYNYTMASQDIVVFADPAIDTTFIFGLLGEPNVYPLSDVFETYYHGDIVIDDKEYWLYQTAGISSSRTGRSSLQAPEVLKTLYSVIPLLDSINLLIYVVCADKPTSDNFRFFYDYLCQQDAPIILVQTTHTPSEVSWFDLVLTLDGADPESDKVNLHKAITKHLNRNPKSIPCIERFESATRGCWKLLGKQARWSLADFCDALKLVCENRVWFTEKDVDAICDRIIEHDQMSLKKQSAIEQVSVGDKIQQRVDAILSTIAFRNITFLSVAAQSIANIGETVQVCATTTVDLWC
jgi:hypothetical protein